MFGLLIEPRANSRTGEKDFLYAVHPGQWVRVPFYTASMGASITVVRLNSEVGVFEKGLSRHMRVCLCATSLALSAALGPPPVDHRSNEPHTHSPAPSEQAPPVADIQTASNTSSARSLPLKWMAMLVSPHAPRLC